MNIVERLKDSLDYEYNLSFSERKQLLEEIDRLNNIINELEKFLNEADIVQRDRENIPNDHITIYNIILNKLKELKENK